MYSSVLLEAFHFIEQVFTEHFLRTRHFVVVVAVAVVMEVRRGDEKKKETLPAQHLAHSLA